jgi:hypothetical protein
MGAETWRPQRSCRVLIILAAIFRFSPLLCAYLKLYTAAPKWPLVVALGRAASISLMIDPSWENADDIDSPWAT